MRVLVTGGAGYIGATTVRRLLQKGHDVLVYDNLSSGHPEAVPEGARFLEGDVADRATLDAAICLHRPEAVLHFAASIEAGESMRYPEKYFRNNSAGTLSLLESMIANGVLKLIFSSSAALYGEARRMPIEESDPLNPTNAYGESKLLVERMLSWFAVAHELRYASLRYFNAAGSDGYSGECHQPESHLIPLILQAAAGMRECISIFGTDYPTPDGTCIRDYVHVSDLADAHLLALEALAEYPNLIYNLGNGCGFSVAEVVDSARRVTGRTISVDEAPRRPGDSAVLVASSQKIREQLGWTPVHTGIDSIIASAWKWMQRHPNGYRCPVPRSLTPNSEIPPDSLSRPS